MGANLHGIWHNAEASDRRQLTTFSEKPIQSSSLRKKTSQIQQTASQPNSFDSSLSRTPDAGKGGVSCSCEKDLNSMYCCQRALIVVHKMGVTAAEDMKGKYFFDMVGTPQIMSDHRYGQLFDAAFESPVIDYRHAVITRNWYESIVSGYLYHKSGRECWLDWFGNPGHQGWLLNNRLEDWERRIMQDPVLTIGKLKWNPGNGRDLCKYLSDESEEMGLRVYSAWAFASFMNPLSHFRRRRLEMEGQSGRNRTTFVCYEDLMSPTRHADAVNSLTDWFFPNKNIKKLSFQQEKYEGGHATDKDPTLRTRLQQIVAKLDADYFAGSIAQGSAEFGCGEASSVALAR